MMRLLCICIACLSLGQYTYAVSDSFQINLLVGDDLIPPTTAVISSVAPVTQTQIDITWGAVTDNVAVGGYQVFRDAVQIATTSLISYSDVGLTASTTYSYTIRAFDTSFNYATISAAVATTTLPIVATTSSSTPSGSGGSGSNDEQFLVEAFAIEVGTTTARFSWQTNLYTRFVLQWGETGSYELGVASSDTYRQIQETLLADLAPDTTYEYELTVYDAADDQYLVSQGTFTTEALPDRTPPPNVAALAGWADGTAAVLSWQNPAVLDFSYIRVVRNPHFYPIDPQDGLIVYQGTGEGMRDETAFVADDDQFYTVFTYDESGNVSSGAVVYVTANPDVAIGAPQVIDDPDPVWEQFSIIDVVVLQSGEVVSQIDQDTRLVIADTPVSFMIAAESLPRHLKSILVTVFHPSEADQSFTFLMRINEEQTAYEATITPFAVAGVFPYVVRVYDFKTRLVREITGELYSQPASSDVVPERDRYYWWYLLVLLLVLGMLWAVWRRRKRDEAASN